MKKIISIIVILATVFALAVPAFASGAEAGKDMWVNCENGKRLNVRSEASTNGRIVTRLDCGTKVHVDYIAGNGWVAISDYHYSGYVQAKGQPAPASPFVTFEGQSWYRTGDLVRQQADGVLVFAGRLGRFVKVGG